MMGLEHVVGPFKKWLFCVFVLNFWHIYMKYVLLLSVSRTVLIPMDLVPLSKFDYQQFPYHVFG